METLGPWTRRLLLAANVFMVIVIVADLFYLTNMITFVDLPSFTLLNLVVLGLGLWSFKVKRDLKARMSRPEGEEPEGPKVE